VLWFSRTRGRAGAGLQPAGIANCSQSRMARVEDDGIDEDAVSHL
jgi:hypothetical protein